MIGNWIALVTLGCFCTLASYAYGTGITARHYSIAAKPVIITRADSHNCGEDWLCVIAWANESHPKKHRH